MTTESRIPKRSGFVKSGLATSEAGVGDGMATDNGAVNIVGAALEPGDGGVVVTADDVAGVVGAEVGAYQALPPPERFANKCGYTYAPISHPVPFKSWSAVVTEEGQEEPGANPIRYVAPRFTPASMAGEVDWREKSFVAAFVNLGSELKELLSWPLAVFQLENVE